MLVHFTFFTLFRYPFLSWTLTSSFSVTFGRKEKVFRSIFIQPYSFMLTLVMLLQIPCCSCGVFTFTKRIFHFLLAVVTAYSHLSQGYLTTSCILLMCRFRSHIVVAVYLHLPQGYLTSSCLLSLCRFRWLAVVAVYSHLSQGYLIT